MITMATCCLIQIKHRPINLKRLFPKSSLVEILYLQYSVARSSSPGTVYKSLGRNEITRENSGTKIEVQVNTWEVQGRPVGQQGSRWE